MARQVEVVKRRRTAMDEDTGSMIFEGCNISQLAKLFRMERRDIQPKIRSVAPCGERGGYPIYFVHEVAPHVVKPIYDVETYIKRMNPQDLPKHLTKEFWAGQRSRQDYEARAGDLWPTDKVVEIFGEAVKVFRMSMLLMRDSLERETELTESQRSRIDTMVDSALNGLVEALVTRFETEARKPAAAVDDDEEV